MGTRHLIAAVVDGEYKIAQYGQWDGYPSAQGLAVLSFLKEADMAAFREKLRACSWADDKYLKNIDKLKNWDKKHPELSRDTGGKIFTVLMDSPSPLKLVDSLSFAAESWHCEWAYVVDLDNGTFEAYKGGNTEQVPDDNRFRNVTSPDQDEYYPVTLIKAFDLEALPSRKEFLLTCDPERNFEFRAGDYDAADEAASLPDQDVEDEQPEDKDSALPIWSA